MLSRFSLRLRELSNAFAARFSVNDAAVAVGFVLLVYGISLWSVPSAFVTAGALLLGVGVWTYR